MKRGKKKTILITVCFLAVVMVVLTVIADHQVLLFRDKTDWPVGGRYGWHISWCMNNYNYPRKNHRHQGVDINLGLGNADLGAPVYATHDGTVNRVRTYKDGNGGGNRVRIASVDGKIATYYMHLDSITVNVGDKIAKGARIGTVGGSGNGKRRHYAPHLHYEVFMDGKHVNPVQNGNLVKLK